MNIETTKIPDIPIPVSRIGLGTWAMGGFQWGGSDDDESVRTIHVVLERGINLIDTAPAYGFGHSEEVIGRAMAERGHRDRVATSTRFWPKPSAIPSVPSSWPRRPARSKPPRRPGRPSDGKAGRSGLF